MEKISSQVLKIPHLEPSGTRLKTVGLELCWNEKTCYNVGLHKEQPLNWKVGCSMP